MSTNDNTRDLLEYALSLGATVELDPETGKLVFTNTNITNTQASNGSAPAPAPATPPAPPPPAPSATTTTPATNTQASNKKKTTAGTGAGTKKSKSKSKVPHTSKPLVNPETGKTMSFEYSQNATAIYGKNALTKRAVVRLLYADAHDMGFSARSPKLDVLDDYYIDKIDVTVLDVTTAYVVELCHQYRQKYETRLSQSAVAAAVYSIVTTKSLGIPLKAFPTTKREKTKLVDVIGRARHQFLHDSPMKGKDNGYDGNDSYYWFVVVYNYLVDTFNQMVNSAITSDKRTEKK